ncbi:phosphatase PAP2 family protein [Pseudomonas sp. UBA4194]|uniref:phosphatase PAP2 family protein n=1 Tax=Pseudomonas sp. UBA4194 TaxID=1947317 RepID=UPI0025DDB0E9|nr:phosphatase PAP2 family protein [Pseudomonas sp. UBA4194]
MSARSRYYLVNLGLPLLLALGVFLAFDLTHLDRLLSDRLYDPATGEFLLQHDRLFEKVTHKWARILPNLTGTLAIVGALLSWVWAAVAARREARLMRVLMHGRLASVLQWCARHRRDFLYMVVAFAISTTVIHYFKSHTSVYCPVETTLYGGTHLHSLWFENFQPWVRPGEGRCWPGGHASSAFSLFVLYFIARRYRWRWSRVVFWGVVVLGMIYGTTRVLQGWHFMSHTLWAGLFVWLSTWFTALLFYGRAALQAPVQRASTAASPFRNVTP